jgi:excisionase family DNA binding protein
MTATDTFIEAIADRVAAKVIEKLDSNVIAGAGQVKARLLTIEEGAKYLGRTKKALEHMIADKAVPIVRCDRRIFLDRMDLDRWIESNK